MSESTVTDHKTKGKKMSLSDTKETLQRYLRGKQTQGVFRMVLLQNPSLIVHSSIAENMPFTLRLESEKNRPYVYGVKLLMQNIIDADKSIFNRREQLCLMKIGMAHSRATLIKRVKRITNDLNDRFKVRNRNKKAAKEVFQLQYDPCDHDYVFDIEKDTRKKMGIPLCSGLAKHLQLPVKSEWVLTTKERIIKLEQLIKLDERPKNSSLITKNFEKYEMTDSDVPKMLTRTGNGICFKLEEENTKYVNSDSQYLFSTTSFNRPKARSSTRSQPCRHLSKLNMMKEKHIKMLKPYSRK